MRYLNAIKISSFHLSRVSLIWLACLGLAIPVSVAAQNIIAFLGGLVLYVCLNSQISFCVRKWIYPILGIIVFFTISQFLHDHSFSRTSNLILIFLLFSMVGQSIQLDKKQALSILGISLTIGLFIGFGIDEYRRPEYPFWATSGAKYANEAGFLALVAVFLSFFHKTPWQWLSISACVLFIIMTMSKAALIGLAAGLGVFMLIRYGATHSLKKLLPGVAGLLLVAVVGSIYFSPDKVQVSVEQPRIDLWVHGLKIAQHDHWLGRGEKQFSQQEMENLNRWLPLGHGFFSTAAKEITPVHGSYNIPFHNLFIHALVEHGVAGLIVLMLFFALPFIIFLANPIATQEVAIGLAIWAAFCIHSFFELGLYNASAILMGLVAGLTGILNGKRE